MKAKKSVLIIALIVVIIFIVVIGFRKTGNATSEPGKYDDFAKCLSEKGAIFYGSFQCPHCTTQKDLFGNSIKYINYVECGPLRGPIKDECIKAEIEAYPTWIINDIKYLGVQDLDKLSKLTGCMLPN